MNEFDGHEVHRHQLHSRNDFGGSEECGFLWFWTHAHSQERGKQRVHAFVDWLLDVHQEYGRED